MKKIIGCVAIAFLISACGWQLRGTTDVPQNVSPLYVSAIDAHGELITLLQRTLKGNGVTLTNNSNAALYSISILEETKDKRTAGVGSNALSSAYELTLKADYEVRAKNSDYVSKATAVSVRSFNYNSASIGSAAQEEALLVKEMRHELVQQMLRRLNAINTHPNTQSSVSVSSATSESSHGQATP
jgi:LPS-assembly lipoprotein